MTNSRRPSRGPIDAKARYRVAARRLRNTAIQDESIDLK